MKPSFRMTNKGVKFGYATGGEDYVFMFDVHTF